MKYFSSGNETGLTHRTDAWRARSGGPGKSRSSGAPNSSGWIGRNEQSSRPCAAAGQTMTDGDPTRQRSRSRARQVTLPITDATPEPEPEWIEQQRDERRGSAQWRRDQHVMRVWRLGRIGLVWDAAHLGGPTPTSDTGSGWWSTVRRDAAAEPSSVVFSDYSLPSWFDPSDWS